MVRRSAGFPSEKHGRANDRSRQTRRDVRDVRFDVHAESRLENGSADEETFHKIRLPLVFVRVFPEYVPSSCCLLRHAANIRYVRVCVVL